LIVVRKLLNRNDGDCEVGSDTDSSILMVSQGDYITLDCNKVYVVTDVNDNGTVRCVSPANPVNDPIFISLEEANEGLNRQLH
jgi:hypothetical protein